METRTICIEQARIYVLVLNTFGRAEEGRIAAVSTDYGRLVRFYESQLLPYGEKYRDGSGMYISFRDGPLKYFNPCATTGLNCVSHFGHGVHDEWVDVNALNQIESKYFMV